MSIQVFHFQLKQ